MQQYDASNKTAFDEGPLFIDRSIGINSSSISTADIDAFRQGVEITQEKHTVGLYKISAGTPGHIIRPVSYGVNELDIISTSSFVEIDYFNPVAYLSAMEPGSTLLNVITFPIITSDNNQLENYLLNGVIEPLSIRPIASFYSIEFPIEAKAFRAALQGGNEDLRRFSSDQVLTVDYVPSKLVPEKILASGSLTSSLPANRAYENRAWFLDSSKTSLTTSSLATSADIPLIDDGHVNPDLNVLTPFDDLTIYLRKLGITAATHGDDMVAVFAVMTGSTGNYVPPGKKSGTAGFAYDNIASIGTDSIAFGGMTY